MKERTKTIIGIVLFLAFFGLSVYGYMFTGEAQTVAMKAQKICMECIGIG